MSGIIGHSLFVILVLKAAVSRKLPGAAIAARHHSSYLAGAYLGCDIQMGEAIANMFSAVVDRSPRLAGENPSDGPTWYEVSSAWRS